MAFAIAYYTTNTNSVKVKTSAINGGLDRICICSLEKLRKRPTVTDSQKAIYSDIYRGTAPGPHMSTAAQPQ